jgi:TRAP-type C4-dicarboxylate transport system permease small subunit
MFRVFKQFFDYLSDSAQKLSIVLGGICLICMLCVAGLGVVFRFLLHNSLSWNEELDGYLFVWLTSFGAAIGYKLRAHPSVEVLVDRFPKILKKISLTLSDLIVLSLGLVFTIYGGQMVQLVMSETASSMDIPMGYPYAALPIGGILLIIHAMAHIINTWVNIEFDRKGDVIWDH